VREDPAGLVRVDDSDERRASFVRSLAILAGAALIGLVVAAIVVRVTLLSSASERGEVPRRWRRTSR
jgi:hypothetical protein